MVVVMSLYARPFLASGHVGQLRLPSPNHQVLCLGSVAPLLQFVFLFFVFRISAGNTIIKEINHNTPSLCHLPSGGVSAGTNLVIILASARGYIPSLFQVLLFYPCIYLKP